MKLVKFKIQNYKRIEDSDWVEVNDVSALVGGNETGKTSVLQALWKLKPARANIALDAQEEFPRRRYTTDYLRGGEWPVVTAVFELDKELIDELITIDPAFKDCTAVSCTNYYDTDQEDIEVEYIPPISSELPTVDDVLNFLKGAAKSFTLDQIDLSQIEAGISTETEDESTQPETENLVENIGGEFCEKAINITNQILEQVKPDCGNSELAEILSRYHEQIEAISPQDWQKKTWESSKKKYIEINEKFGFEDKLREAKQIVWSALPVFIYFDDLNLLNTEIFIPDAISQIASGSTEPEVRSQWALFELTGFDIEEISELIFQMGPDQPQTDEAKNALFQAIKERAIVASAASRSITEDFSDWWHQQRHMIDFRVDGQTLQIWVSDNKYPIPIQFESRSKGFRWFFTFYLVFTAETDYEHSNAVILLDEPGLHLYPPAQEELLQLFDELSLENQIIYTTHLPFLVDSRHLERVRVVEEMDDGLVRISNEISPSGGKVVFPVQAALGYQLAQTLFLAKRVLVVEGETDYKFFIFMSDLLKGEGKHGLPDGMAISFAGGNSSVRPLISMMAPQGIEIVVLLDNDESGRSAGQKLENTSFTSLPNIELMYLGDILGKPDPFELENLLPVGLCKKSIQETHGLKIPGTVKASKNQTLSKAIKGFLKENGIQMDKSKAMQWILDKWRSEGELPEGIINSAEMIFLEIQEAMERIDSQV